jgi:hypothetical protein
VVARLQSPATFCFCKLTSANAVAGVIFEPYFGAESGKFVADVKYKGAALLSISSTYYGPAIGVRGGLEFAGISVGPELALAALTTAKRGSVAPVDLGGMAGIALGSLRVRASYFPYSKASDLKGSSVKGSLGLLLMPNVMINVEYISRKFSDYTLQSLPGVTVVGTFKSYLLTLSLPIDSLD